MLGRPIVDRPSKHAKPMTSYRGQGKRMKAIGAHEPGGPEALRLEDTETLEPELGQALKKVGGAGVNYADTGMRKGMR
jgi:D-arabinose 1-dehydrogenase-like Zn-dependent alcohol dehydrogenase